MGLPACGGRPSEQAVAPTPTSETLLVERGDATLATEDPIVPVPREVAAVDRGHAPAESFQGAREGAVFLAPIPRFDGSDEPIRVALSVSVWREADGGAERLAMWRVAEELRVGMEERVQRAVEFGEYAPLLDGERVYALATGRIVEPGFQTAKAVARFDHDERPSAWLHLEARRGATIEGRVLDGDGVRVPHGHVWVEPHPERTGRTSRGAEIRRGYYAVHLDEPGAVTVRARAAGVGTAVVEAVQVDATSSATRCDLTLQGPARLAGVVLDASGAPAGRTRLRVRPAEVAGQRGIGGAGNAARFAEPGGLRDVEATTDERGGFAFTGLADGSYRISAVLGRNAGDWVPLHEEPLATSDSALVLRSPEHRIEVRLVDAWGEPTPFLHGVPIDPANGNRTVWEDEEIYVRAFVCDGGRADVDDWVRAFNWIRLDERGTRWAFRGEPGEEYVVQALTRDFVIEPVRTRVVAGSPSPVVELRMGAAKRLGELHVEFASAPGLVREPPIVVTALDAELRVPIEQRQSRRPDSMRLELPAGDYEVVVDDPYRKDAWVHALMFSLTQSELDGDGFSLDPSIPDRAFDPVVRAVRVDPGATTTLRIELKPAGFLRVRAAGVERVASEDVRVHFAVRPVEGGGWAPLAFSRRVGEKLEIATEDWLRPDRAYVADAALAEGEWMLRATCAGYEVATRRFTMIGGEVAEVTVRLEPASDG